MNFRIAILALLNAYLAGAVYAFAERIERHIAYCAPLPSQFWLPHWQNTVLPSLIWFCNNFGGDLGFWGGVGAVTFLLTRRTEKNKRLTLRSWFGAIVAAFLLSCLRIMVDHIFRGVDLTTNVESWIFLGSFGVAGGIGALIAVSCLTRHPTQLEMLLQVPVTLETECLEKLKRILKDDGDNIQVQELDNGQNISLSGSAKVLHLLEPLLDDRQVLPEGTTLSVKDSKTKDWVPMSGSKSEQ